MTQLQRLEEYLLTHDNINPLQAWNELGIYRLSAVVFDLRKEGLNIHTGRMKVRNKFGETCEVGLYSIVKAVPEPTPEPEPVSGQGEMSLGIHPTWGNV